AGVHDPRQSVDFDHPGLYSDPPRVGVGTPELRGQQIGVVMPGGRGRIGEECAGQFELQLDYSGDGGPTEADTVVAHVRQSFKDRPRGHEFGLVPRSEWRPEWRMNPHGRGAMLISTDRR